MRFLLDTVAAVMWWTEAGRLGKRAHDIIERSENDLFLSAVSIWEIANKNRIGKLEQVEDFRGQFSSLLRASGFAMLDLSAAHAMTAGYLPGAHRDPFDRLLAGQALVEKMIVVTNDPRIAEFGCETIW